MFTSTPGDVDISRTYISTTTAFFFSIPAIGRGVLVQNSKENVTYRQGRLGLRGLVTNDHPWRQGYYSTTWARDKVFRDLC